MIANAEGVYPIAPTPFNDIGNLDLHSAERMVDIFLNYGATGITILGMMGEAPKLTFEESLSLVKTAIRSVNNRVPVIVGVSSPGFADMKQISNAVMDAGASGVMVSPVVGLKSNEQILNYFDEVVKAIGDDVPFVLQDFPLGTNVVMSADVIYEIVSTHRNCTILKLEDWPGLEKISKLRSMKNTKETPILCGNGGIFLPFELERGADGAMTGYAFPEMLMKIVELIGSGKREEAHDLFDKHLPLIRYETQPGMGLSVRKYVLKKRGIIDSDFVRAPGPKLSKVTISEVEWILQRINT